MSKLSEKPSGSKPTSPTHPLVLAGSNKKGMDLDMACSAGMLLRVCCWEVNAAAELMLRAATVVVAAANFIIMVVVSKMKLTKRKASQRMTELLNQKDRGLACLPYDGEIGRAHV